MRAIACFVSSTAETFLERTASRAAMSVSWDSMRFGKLRKSAVKVNPSLLQPVPCLLILRTQHVVVGGKPVEQRVTVILGVLVVVGIDADVRRADFLKLVANLRPLFVRDP